jgi:hypothetical protein
MLFHIAIAPELDVNGDARYHNLYTVIPGLGPGIHAFLPCGTQGVDPGA